MKLAIIGSRSITDVNVGEYMPQDVSEIVSGGARGVDTLAKNYAEKIGLKYTEFLPDYNRYKRGAPIKRNVEIAEYSDAVLAFWDGESNGTSRTIKLFQERNKPVILITIEK